MITSDSGRKCPRMDSRSLTGVSADSSDAIRPLRSTITIRMKGTGAAADPNAFQQVLRDLASVQLLQPFSQFIPEANRDAIPIVFFDYGEPNPSALP